MIVYYGKSFSIVYCFDMHPSGAYVVCSTGQVGNGWLGSVGEHVGWVMVLWVMVENHMAVAPDQCVYFLELKCFPKKKYFPM